MKKNYYILLIAIIASINSFSQKKGDINLGIITGANYSIPYGDDISKAKDYYKSKADKSSISPALNIKVGGLFDYSISDKLSINVGLTYTKRGWTEKFESNTELDAYYVEYTKSLFKFKEGEVNYELSYVDIPFLLRLKLNSNLFFHGGFTYSIKTADKLDYNYLTSSGLTLAESDYFIDYFIVAPNDRIYGIQAGIDIHLSKGWNLDITAQRTGKILPARYDVGFNTLSLSLKKFIWLNKKEK